MNRMASLPVVDRQYYVAPVLAVALLGTLHYFEIGLPSILILLVGVPVMLALLAMGPSHPLPLLLVITVYVPFSKVFPGGFGGLMTGLNLTTLLIGTALLVWLLRSHPGVFLTPTPFNLPFLALALTLLLSLFVGASSFGVDFAADTLVIMKRWVDPFLLYILFVNLLRTKAEIRNVAVVMLVTITAAALLGFLEHWDRLEYAVGAKRRLQGLSEHSNTSGAFFVYYLFVFPALFLTGRFTVGRFVLLAVPTLLCLRVIMFTGSRGALLGVAVAALFLGLVRARFAIVGCLALALLAWANPQYVPSIVAARFGILYDAGAAETAEDIAEAFEKSAAQRIIIWRGALDMIADNPVLGVGYGAFPYLIGRYTDNTARVGDAHNVYLLIAAELGIPALLLFLLLIGLAFREAWRLYRRGEDPFLRGLGLGLAAGIVGLVVTGMFGSRFNSFELVGYFWILTALVVRGRLIESQEARQQPDAAAEQQGGRRHGPRSPVLLHRPQATP
jgi:putative inorganic carbon (hco3(-)) transporter